MKNQNAHWGILAGLIALIAAACLLRPLPPPKARGTRIQSVNHVARVSFTLSATNAISTNKPVIRGLNR